MLGFQRLRIGIGTVALEAKSVGGLRPKQVIVVAAVRLMARSATLLEGWLVMNAFLREVRDVTVAAQADVNRISFRKSRLPAGMGVVAVGAIARRSRMRHLGTLDGFGFVIVASHAK